MVACIYITLTRYAQSQTSVSAASCFAIYYCPAVYRKQSVDRSVGLRLLGVLLEQITLCYIKSDWFVSFANGCRLMAGFVIGPERFVIRIQLIRLAHFLVMLQAMRWPWTHS